MADSHVISALSTKRGEILGSIKHYKQLISSLDKDLANIDATIKIFDVDYDISSIKPVIKSRNRFFNNVVAKVLVLEVLKNSSLTLSTDKILYNYYKESKKYYDDLFDICALSLGVVTLLIVDFYYYESLARQGILLLINSEYILVSLLGIFLISVPFLIIGFFAEYIQGKSYVQINRQIQKKLFLRKYNNDKIKR